MNNGVPPAPIIAPLCTSEKVRSLPFVMGGDRKNEELESDWVSEWGSDWESGAERKENSDEPKVKKLRSGGRKCSRVDEEGAAAGLTCHSCLQRTVKENLRCSRCPNSFCGLCLFKNNAEQIGIEVGAGMKWVCPKCRAGCGPGCSNCCTCAACRKSQGLAPTGQLLRIARVAGFNNVHDYLIHCQTGESPDEIAKRKDGRSWIKAGATGISGEQQPPLSWTAAEVYTEVPPAGALIWERPKKVVKEMDGQCQAKPGVPMLGSVSWGSLIQIQKKDAYEDGLIHKVNTSVNCQKIISSGGLGKGAPKLKGTLNQIIDRLLHLEDPAFYKVPKSLGSMMGSVGQIRRNRRHRALGRFISSMLVNQNAGCKNKDKMESQGFVNQGHLDQASKVSVQSEEKGTSVQAIKKADGHHEQASNKLIQLKKPVTSLQALRKMEALSKLDHVDKPVTGFSQQEGPATLPPIFDSLDKGLKESVQHKRASILPSPSSTDSELGLQAILRRHLERRKKIEVRPNWKLLKTTSTVPVNERPENATWRDIVTPNQSLLQGGFESFGCKESVTEVRNNGLKTGFEHFSSQETLTGFESFRGEDAVVTPVTS